MQWLNLTKERYHNRMSLWLFAFAAAGVIGVLFAEPDTAEAYVYVAYTLGWIAQLTFVSRRPPNDIRPLRVVAVSALHVLGIPISYVVAGGLPFWAAGVPVTFFAGVLILGYLYRKDKAKEQGPQQGRERR